MKLLTLRHYALILLCAGVVFFTNLGGPKLWDIDEPRNAGCAAEMLAAGDWVVPVFNAELRVHKPVLLYWFMISAYEMFGVNEFAARFWSALLGLGTVLMSYHMARRLLGPTAALWSAIVLCSTLSFVIAARAATPDSVLIFFTTAATLVYVLGTWRPQARQTEEDADTRNEPVLRAPGEYFPQSWPVVALMYALMGLAVLAKGPIGLVLPTAVIGMFLLIKRLRPISALRQAAIAGIRYRMNTPVRIAFDASFLFRPFAPMHFLRTCWSMRPLTAIAMVLLVAGPWYAWVGLRTDGAWLRGFFLEHNVQRAVTAMEGHSGSILYYPAALLAFTFPWSIFAMPLLIDLVRRLRRRDAWNDGFTLAACWVAVYIILFSLASTKLPSYITPMYPAAAMIYGGYFYLWSRGKQLHAPGWSYAATAVLATVGLGLLITLPIAAHVFVPGEEWLGLLGLLPLLTAGGFAWFLKRRQQRRAAVALASLAVVFATMLFGVAAIRVSHHQNYDALVHAIGQETEIAEPRIASFGCMEPSWVFYTGRPIEELGGGHAAVDRLATFLRHGGDEAYVITTREAYEGQLHDTLGDEVDVVAETPYFLKDETLLLLTPKPAPRVAVQPDGAMRY